MEEEYYRWLKKMKKEYKAFIKKAIKRKTKAIFKIEHKGINIYSKGPYIGTIDLVWLVDEARARKLTIYGNMYDKCLRII